MTKEEALQSIRELSASGELSPEEVKQAYAQQSPPSSPVTPEHHATSHQPANHFNFVNILYGLGGLVVLLGMLILVLGSWSDLTPNARIVISVGSCVAMFVSAGLLWSTKKQSVLSDIGFLIAGIILPFAIGILVSQSSQMDSKTYSILVTGSTTVILTSLIVAFRRNVLVALSAGSFVALYYAVGSAVLVYSINNTTDEYNYYAGYSEQVYAPLLISLIALGLGYIFIGHYVRKLKNWAPAAKAFHHLGSLLILGTGLVLSYSFTEPYKGAADIIYPAFAVGLIYYGVNTGQRLHVAWGMLFTVFFVVKLSSSYFATTAGWPLLLILIGLIIMALGYAFFVLNEKYIKKNKK